MIIIGHFDSLVCVRHLARMDDRVRRYEHEKVSLLEASDLTVFNIHRRI